MAKILLYKTCGDIIATEGKDGAVGNAFISSTIPGLVPGQIGNSYQNNPRELYPNFNFNVNEVITIRCKYDSILNNGAYNPSIGIPILFGGKSLSFIYNAHTPGDVHEITSDGKIRNMPEFSISFDSFQVGAVIKNFTLEVYAEMNIDKEYIRTIPMRFENKTISRFDVKLDESKISSCGLLFKFDNAYHTIMSWRDAGTNSIIFGTKEITLNSDPVTVRNILTESTSLSTMRNVNMLKALKGKDVDLIVAYYPKDETVGDLKDMPISILPNYKGDFSLIKLAQIEKGLDLQQEIDVLKTSYDALKVLTNISKGESLGNYNVNELLVSLKATLESIVGGEGGSGSAGSLVDIQQQISIINNKIIKDVVKLEMNVVNHVVVLPPNLAELVPKIDTSKKYPVYNIDNTIIFNEKGEQLLFDFTLNQFIGTPSIIDPDCKDPNHLTYVAIDVDFNFKVFAIGSFSFANLPIDALLDNQEMVIVAYNQVLNQIIVNLANNTELINEIKVLVSNEVIQQQILAITNVLEQRITYIEQNGCKVSNEFISTVINDIDIAVDTKVTSEKAVAIAIANAAITIKNEINTNIVNVTDRLEALESFAEQVDKIAITESGAKTQFTLTKIPNELEIVLNINGVDYQENEAFTANRTEKAVTWTATKAEGGFDITPQLTPVVRVLYKVGKKLEYVPGESEKS